VCAKAVPANGHHGKAPARKRVRERPREASSRKMGGVGSGVGGAVVVAGSSVRQRHDHSRTTAGERRAVPRAGARMAPG